MTNTAHDSAKAYDYKRVHVYGKPVRDADSNENHAREWHTTVSMPLDEYYALLARTPGEDTLMLSHYIRIEANRLRRDGYTGTLSKATISAVRASLK